MSHIGRLIDDEPNCKLRKSESNSTKPRCDVQPAPVKKLCVQVNSRGQAVAIVDAPKPANIKL